MLDQQTLYLLVGSLSIILGVSLLLRKLPASYYFFGANIVIVGYALLTTYMVSSKLILSYPYLFRSSSPLQYLYGPFNYFFVLYILFPARSWRKKDWLHFIPFLLHTIQMIPFFMLPASEKLGFLMNSNSGDASADTFHSIILSSELYNPKLHMGLKLVQILVYGYLVYRLYSPVMRSTKQHALYKNNLLLLRWIRFDNIIKMTSYSLLLIYVAGYTFLPVLIKNFGTSLFLVDNIFGIVFLLFNPSLLKGIRWRNPITMLGINNSSDNAVNDLIEEESNTIPEEPEPVATVAIETKDDETRLKEIFVRLDQYMQVEQPFLNNKISLQEIATKLRIPAYLISKSLNRYYGQSFPGYINLLRLHYIDERFRNDEQFKQFSVLAMSMEAGFNSKNAFYTAFRKLRNTTPTEYYQLSDTE